MINHFWTLLLNINGSEVESQLKGSEYVDPAFRKRAQRDELVRLRTGLFGTRPDFSGRVFRAQQLMRLLRAFDWEDEIDSYDTRNTYDSPELEIGEYLLSRSCTATPMPTNVGTLLLQTRPDTDDRTGRLRWSWNVEVTDSDQVTAYVTDRPEISVQSTFSVDSGGNTGTLPLPNLGGTFMLKDPSVGDSWAISAVVHPSVSVVDVCRYVVSIPQPQARSILGDIVTEPGLSWWNIWQTHPEYLNRLCAMVVGLVRSTHLSPAE